MTLHLVYDDATPAPPAITALIGIERFGELIFRRERLSDHLHAAAAAAGIDSVIELRGQVDVDELARRRRQGDWANDQFLLIPSNIVNTRSREDMVQFLRQVLHAPGSLILRGEHPRRLWDGWLLLSTAEFSDYLQHRHDDSLATFFERIGRELVSLSDKLGLIDLTEEGALLDFLSGAFDARFFNSLARDQYTIVKRSTDKAKLDREYRFYDLLPDNMRMFFIQPFEFADEGDVASYRMERLYLPDMALQWLHGAVRQHELALFLDKIFHFIDLRRRRPVSSAEMGAKVDELYVDKVRDRVAQFKQQAEYTALEPYLERLCGGIDRLLERYLALFVKARAKLCVSELAIGHGDLCFSNILYDKRTQFLRLIDPRGATREEDLYTHPYYDLAKLSHSIIGGYDIVNHDMFDVQIGADMVPRLIHDLPPRRWAATMFRDRLEQAGFDPVLVRLCEASLFISMLPLHIDRPLKVLGFAITAANMVQSLEDGTAMDNAA